MSNQDNPHGLRAVISQANKNPRMTKYRVGTTTPVYKDDVVQLLATGKVKTITTVGGVNAIIGTAASYGGTSNTTGIWVFDDPDTLFEVQSDGTTDPGASTALSKIGNTANLILTTGNTATKNSKHELDYSDLGTDTTAPLKVLGYHKRVTNNQNSSHAIFLVKLNRHINSGRYAV